MIDPVTGAAIKGIVPVVAGTGAAAAMTAAVVAAAPVLVPVAIIVGLFAAVSESDKKKA